MKILNKTLLIALVTIVTAFAGCSKSDDSNPENQDTFGPLGKYDITINGQQYTGDVGDISEEGGDGVFAMATMHQASGITHIGFALSNTEIIASGGFQYPNGQNQNVSLDEEGNSSISFILHSVSNDGYDSKSGTAKIIVGEKISAPDGSGSIIEVQIDFQGVFTYYDENGAEKTADVSGTFKNNLPRM